MSNLAFLITGSGVVSGVLNSKVFSFQPDFARYDEVKQALMGGDESLLQELVDFAANFSKYGKGQCVCENGVVKYNGKPIANTVTERIMKMRELGFPIDPMLRFLENLMMNPSQDAINELYLFLETGMMPITEDGYFLAYKAVASNYKSFHASPDGTHIDHAIGQKPSMPRHQVDPDRYNTCSRGLHFCSLGYLPQAYSSCNHRVIILKINPADVVAIPADYQNKKGRAWIYEVIGEHIQGHEVEAFDKPVVSSRGGEYVSGLDEDGDEIEDEDKEEIEEAEENEENEEIAPVEAADDAYGVKPSGQRYYQKRDSKGHFIKRS